MEYFCSETIQIWSLVGTVVTILKIGIPLIIIVMAIIDLGKAAVSSKPEDVTKAFGTLVKRLIAGLVIFFIPTIVNLVFGLIDDFDEGTDYGICSACVAGADCYVKDGFCGSGNEGEDTEQCDTGSKYIEGN